MRVSFYPTCLLNAAERRRRGNSRASVRGVSPVLARYCRQSPVGLEEFRGANGQALHAVLMNVTNIALCGSSELNTSVSFLGTLQLHAT